MLSCIAMSTASTPCPLCGGTGWKPVEEGSVRRVVGCECRAAAAYWKRVAAARIPARYEHCDFQSFQVNVHDHPAYNQSLRQARFLAERFAQEYPAQNDFGLLFMGPCGVGKTHLGVAILRALIEKGVDSLFCDFRELLKSIQSSYNPVAQTSEMEILAPVLEAEVLLLDDLGASKPSVWVLDTVAHVLNSRYNDKRATLITTNFPDEPAAEGQELTRELRAARKETLGDRIGERMRSRLHEMCRTVQMQGEDFRTRVRSASFRP